MRSKNIMIMTVSVLVLISSFLYGELWEHYTKDNSQLPSDDILATAIDNMGFKWIGTSSGLVRITGETWTVFNTSNSGIPSNYIRAIAIHPQNDDIWLGTNNGLVRFTGATWTVYNTTNSSLPKNVVASVVIDEFGVVWAGTLAGGGLAKFDNGVWTVYKSSNSDLPNNYVQALAKGADNTIWIGTDNGAATFDGETWEVYTATNSVLRDNSIRVIEASSDSVVAIGTANGGFVVIENNNWSPYHMGNSNLPSNSITSIAIKPSGILWIGTEDGGLVKKNNNQWTIFDEQNSDLISNQIRSIAIDSNFKKWIGTAAGLACYKGVSVTGVEVTPSYVAIKKGDSVQLEAEIIPANATIKDIFWVSLDENIATVNDSGYVTSVDTGVVMIKAISPDGERSGYSEVNVTGTVKAPIFNPPGGDYNEVLFVKITSETNDVQIYYTFDESEPDSLNAALYSEHIRVGSTMTIKAIAYKKDWEESKVTSATYNITTSAEEYEQIPITHRSSVYPNPFQLSGGAGQSDEISIRYDVQCNEGVKIEVYNIKGRKIRGYQNRTSVIGENTFSFKVNGSGINKLPVGIYFYTISSDKTGEIGRGKFSIIR